MHTLNPNKRLILASRSPRREHLIKGLDMEVKMVFPEDIDESFPPELPVVEVPVYLAKKKSDHFKEKLGDNDILITADTIVLLEGEVVNKPDSLEKAKQMLSRLSGNKHTVITGVYLRSNSKSSFFSSFTDVHFGSLTPEEIVYYVEKYQPLDKAGAYGIQEWIGYVGVEKIEGSFFNVMGLPLFQLFSEIQKF